jgi:hypothetical protein
MSGMSDPGAWKRQHRASRLGKVYLRGLWRWQNPRWLKVSSWLEQRSIVERAQLGGWTEEECELRKVWALCK